MVQLKFLFFLGIILLTPLNPAQATISIKELQYRSRSITMKIPKSVPLDLEIAKNPEEIAWGLMGRSNLPKDSGMLFTYRTPRALSFWMFNTYINLSIAFLDEYHIIREMHDLIARPDKMRNYPRVKDARDLSKLSSSDPTVAFFLKEQIFSSFPGSFALEVPLGWFKDKQIGIGDVLVWKQGKTRAVIMRSIDISQLPLDASLQTLITLEEAGPLSIWLNSEEKPRDVAFLDYKGIEVKKTTLAKGNVFSTQTPIKYILIAPARSLTSLKD